MHELSICYALLDQLERIASERNATRVTQVVIKIGPLSGVDATLLVHAYPLAAAGTRAQDAQLVMEKADLIVGCDHCGAQSSASVNRLVCGQCGDFRTRIVSGDELILQRVEVVGVT